MRNVMKRIAITGPESTGKSTLSAQLASRYQTVWVPEYAREYLTRLDRPYTIDDLLAIAKGQIQLEQSWLEKASRVLFSDTELIVMKVWSEHAFGQCPEWILRGIAQQQYDLYLLTGIDIPWQPDPQREHPHLRQYFYELYRRELQERNLNFVEIHGTPSERLSQAIQSVELVLFG
jgi:NadR type nicotinamide-nucleotide adenylyltransferase